MELDALILRAKLINTVRDFFEERCFLEVETPLLIPANAPEEYINPIVTIPFWQLQTSPEICMKRLLCRGYQNIFQISHCWRSEERGSRHLSEFTMLEWYRANSDYHQLMTDCKELMQYVASTCLTDPFCFSHNSARINPFLPWQYISVKEAFLSFAHINVLDCLKDGLYEEILTSIIEPELAKINSPVILMDYPSELAALARTKPGNQQLAERFELYVGGMELANGFSELNDPVEQRRRFEDTNLARENSGQLILPLPEPFLNDLSKMLPSAGIALGIDRLVMLTAGINNIDEVVAFTPDNL